MRIETATPAQRAKKRGAPYTAAIVQKAVADRNLCSPPLGSLDSDLESSYELSSESSSDTYSDPDTDPDTGIELDIRINSDSGRDVESDGESDAQSDAELDSEAEEILQDIAQLGKEGPAKPNHTPHTKKLWKREGEFWKR
jgi:hypothetical protein